MVVVWTLAALTYTGMAVLVGLLIVQKTSGDSPDKEDFIMCCGLGVLWPIVGPILIVAAIAERIWHKAHG